MKLSKRMTALFAAVLMAITVFSSAFPAYAKYNDFSCGSAVARGYVTSNTRLTGAAWTESKNGTTKFSYLYAAVFGTRVDKNGDNPRYLSGPGKESSGTNSGMDVLKAIADNSGDYYARVVSANVGTYNGKTNSTTVAISR